MRIRTQLILAAFVLAVVPLVAIVTYSYHSSRRALESAYRREADRLTSQMDRRLESIRAELDQRLIVVSALAQGGTPADVGRMVSVMGDTSSLVDSLEYKPLPVAPPAEPLAPAPPAPPAPEDPGEPEDPDESPEPADNDPEVELAELPEVRPLEPIVIEIPPVPVFPQFQMSEDTQELIAEVGRLSGMFTKPDLTQEQRADLRAELADAQRELKAHLAEDQRAYRVRMDAAREQFRARQRRIEEQRAAREKARLAQNAPVPAPAPAPPAPKPKPAAQAKARPKPKVKVREATATDLAQTAASSEKTALILGRRFQTPVRKEGEVVGQLTARVSPEQVIQRILGGATDDRTEIPFALDREGTLYTRSGGERTQLERLGIPQRVRQGRSTRDIEGWIVTSSVDQPSGLRIGVARPVDNLDELRRTAARNFALGIGLIGLALIGIVPLSNHLTRDVKLVTAGAERIAQGDLMTRLPVKTDNELGQLARAFNRMAEDLSIQQQLLLEQERTAKEQELQQRLLAVEYERKSVELEDARRFQLSMLPKEVPRHPSFEVAVFTRTATEVGGDYYDFHVAEDVLSVTIGDATGHGAKAGTMVTVIKTLFAGYDGATAPAEFLADAADKIKRMDLGRMAMALSLGRFEKQKLTLASAGMPPVLVHRAAQNVVDEVALAATPLGTFGSHYPQKDVDLASGDTVLFLTDGFPELMNDAGQQLGYTGALDAFVKAASAANANGVIASLEETARRWHGELPPNDDVTFVVVRIA